MQKIKSGDISVVVQGPNVKRHTAKCLKSLRKNFPGAEIIFSTPLFKTFKCKRKIMWKIIRLLCC